MKKRDQLSLDVTLSFFGYLGCHVYVSGPWRVGPHVVFVLSV